MNFICAFALAAFISACSHSGIEGQWVERIPGMEGMIQGINIEKDGKASSINMATLQYDAWKKEGDKLILSGKSIGNHQTISFTDTLTIEKLTADKLILKKGDMTIKYRKQ